MQVLIVYASRFGSTFAGVIDLEHWPPWGRAIFRVLGGRPGDNRNWTDIDAWADEIGASVASISETAAEPDSASADRASADRASAR